MQKAKGAVFRTEVKAPQVGRQARKLLPAKKVELQYAGCLISLRRRENQAAVVHDEDELGEGPGSEGHEVPVWHTVRFLKHPPDGEVPDHHLDLRSLPHTAQRGKPSTRRGEWARPRTEGAAQ